LHNESSKDRKFFSESFSWNHCGRKAGINIPRFYLKKARKKPFSVFERRLLPVEGEKERTPFVFIANPNRIQNPRLGTRFETFCGRFYANQRVFLSLF
jgi:hypothetical protein